MLKYCEGRANYFHLGESRARHAIAVNNAFSALVHGNFRAIYNVLPEEVRETTDFNRYCISLSRAREQYYSLSPKARKELAVAVAFHDIGYLHDLGINHGQAGAKMVSEYFMRKGIYGIDRMAVSEIVQWHGIYIDALVHFTLEEIKHFSDERKTQFLIMNLVDVAGKLTGNGLTQNVLDTIFGIKDGRYDDPEKYFELRLRCLLGIICYSYLGEVSFQSLLDTIKRDLTEEDRQSLFRNIVSRFKNGCWPVFQELAMKYGKVRDFLALIIRLSHIADREFPDKKFVYIQYEPDFFKLPDEERRIYLGALAYNVNGNYLSTLPAQNDTGIIVVNLGKLPAPST